MIRKTILVLSIGTLVSAGAVSSLIPIIINKNSMNNSENTNPIIPPIIPPDIDNNIPSGPTDPLPSIPVVNIDSLRKWEVLANHAISSQSIDDFNQILESIIEYLYTQQNNLIKTINASYSIAKAEKSKIDGNQYLSFSFSTVKTNAELDALINVFFSKDINWNDFINYCNQQLVLGVKDAKDMTSVKIIYSYWKELEKDNIVTLMPEKIIISILNQDYEIIFTDEQKNSSFYSLNYVWNNIVSAGTVVELNQNITTSIILNNTEFDYSDFSNIDIKNDSIVDIANKINTKSFIFDHKQILFRNYEEILNTSYIDRVVATPSFNTSSINMEVYYKNVDFKSEFSIMIPQDNLLIFSNLVDIHDWNNLNNPQSINIGNNISNATMLNYVISYLKETIKNKYNQVSYFDNFITPVSGFDNRFIMQLNPNGTETNTSIIRDQFIKLFAWEGGMWDKTVSLLGGTFPNTNKISNIIGEFSISVENNLSSSNTVKVKVLPVSIKVTFSNNTFSELKWYFSNELQNLKAYYIYFKKN